MPGQPGEDVSGRSFRATDHVGVNAERHGWIGVTEPRRDNMYRHSGQQERGGVPEECVSGTGSCVQPIAISKLSS